MTTSSNESSNFAQGDAVLPRIGITMGEPAGIGAEVIVKALANPQIRQAASYIIYGMNDVLEGAADAAGIRPFWFSVPSKEAALVERGVVVVDFPEYAAGAFLHARSTAQGGKASLTFLDAAIVDVKAGTLQALVTAPIHKTSWAKARCRFAGHTEWLADALGAKRVTMSFFGGDLRVALASAHVPLFGLRNQFTIGMVHQPIDLLHAALQNWFGIESPRLAVAGLNPHAGEEGRLGDEEKRIIEPAMLMAQMAGIDVQGPFPADTLFLPGRRAQFDGIIAMYHDQGLIPVKMIAFDSAVNVTLGLPIVRTSPDHGTAFDIVGTNRANPGSMSEALRLAARLSTQAIRRGDVKVEAQTPTRR